MIQKLLQTEPSLLIGAITAVLGLAVGYGLLTQAHADAWIALLLAIPPLLQALVTRQSVFSPAATQAIANAATTLSPGTPVDIGNPPSGDVPPSGGG